MPDENSNILIQEWKTCVEMADSISRRRDNSNNLYVTFNLAIIAGIVMVWDVKSLVLGFAGIIISAIWFKSIRYYKSLNEEKYLIINRLEEKLPYKPYTEEWQNLLNRSKYKDGTSIEMYLTKMFIVFYILSILIITIPRITELIK